MPLGVDEVFLQDLVRHEFSLVVYHIELVWKHSLTQPSFILLQLLVLLLFLFSIQVLVTHLISYLNYLWVVFDVRVDNESGQSIVFGFINFISYNSKKIKS